MLKNLMVASVLALSISAVANECTVPEDKQLLYFVLDTAIASDSDVPSREKMSRYAWAISYADGERDRIAKNLACVQLASALGYVGQINSQIDLLAECSSETIELARHREHLRAASGSEDVHEDFLPTVRVAPVYPSRALEDGRSGVVVAVFTVDEKGRVKSAKVLASSDKIFDQAALRAVRKFRYNPRDVNGEPVAVPQVTTIVSMMLQGDESYTKELNCP